jgi:hypothetical protein
LGTRLDSLQSLLSKLPVKWVFCPIIKELCYYSRAMMTWAQCSVVIWCFLIWKNVCGILLIYLLLRISYHCKFVM